MKKYIIGLLFCSLARIAMSQSNAREAAVNAVPVHTITLPLERTVFQRVNNEATIRLAGQLRTIRFISQVQYKVEKLDKYGTVTGIQTDWTSLALNPIILSGGLFSTTLNNVPTGWYNVQIRTRLGFTGSLYEYSAPTKFGIGEVLFFAGQSNAQGAPLDLAGGTPTFSGQPYDCISAINQNCWCKNTYDFPKFYMLTRDANDRVNMIAPNGNQNVWCYEALGRKLVDQAEISEGKVVPIVVFNAGAVGTAVNNWKESAENEQAVTLNPNGFYNCQTNFADWNSEGAAGHPYRGLKTSLNYYGGMVGARGVIWHQGEGDTQVGTNQDDYKNRLKVVIDKSRQHFNPNLNWAISRVSRLNNSTTSINVINGQQNAQSQTSNTRWGAYYSDDILDRFDQLHFNAQGLIKLADLYSTGTFSGNTNPTVNGNILGMTAIASQLAPSINATFNPDQSQVTLTVIGSYSSYCWVSGNGKMNSCQSTNNSITIPNSGVDTDWRCYVTNSTGQVTISQTANVPLPRLSIFDKLFLSLRPQIGGTGSFKVNADRIDWSISNIPSWVSLSIIQGTDGQTQVNVTFQSNNGPERSATLVVSGIEDASRQEVVISQEGNGGGNSTCPNVGSISYQRWENIGGGTAIQDLRNNTNNLNNAPSTTQTLSLFEAPSDIMDNYGVRIRGYVCPPTTGNYTFWIAGDDNSELWISPNDQPSSLSRIAYHTAWTPSREWGWFGTQQSAPVTLQAGQRYYVEALMKEGSGGDNLAVGWQLPNGSLERPIPGNRLIPFAGGGGSSCNFSVAPSTSNGTPSCGASVTLNANCSGSDCSGVSYTWSGNGLSSSSSSVSTNVPSSNGTYTYTVTASKSGCGNQTGSVNVTVSGCSGGGSLNQCIESESSSGSGAITSDPNASNGSTRGEENNYNHYVDYVVTNVPSAGTYYVKLRYYSSAAPTIGVQINGGGSSSISLPSSGSWNIVWAEHTFTVSLSAGTNTIRIQGTGGGSCRQDRICVSNNPLRIGLEKESLSTDTDILELYPNPTGGKVTVQYYLEKGQKASLQFINASGQVLLQKVLSGEGGWQKTQTDLSEQPEGSYAVRMETQEKIVSRKFLIIK